MNITEVRIQLTPGREDKLRAFCAITLEAEIAVRDVRIIEGPKGLFVAMPSRKITQRCNSCGGKNPLRARFCGDCGIAIQARPTMDRRLHADVVHPINPAAREKLEKRILEAYRAELERAKEPGYRPVEISDTADV